MPIKFLVIFLFVSLSFAMEKDSGWKFLKQEDTIGVCFPSAAPLNAAQLNGIEEFINSQGFKCRLNRDAINSKKSMCDYYSNGTKERAEEFVKLLLDHEVKAILCGRGGFGAYEVVRYIESNKLLQNKNILNKPMFGFSDICYFEQFALDNNIPFFHAPLIGLTKELYSITKSSVNKETSFEQVIDILRGKIPQVVYKWKLLGGVINSNNITAILGGGNISVLSRCNGTKFKLKVNKDMFIFLEDTSEDPKRLTDILLGLIDSWDLELVKGIFFGNLPLGSTGQHAESTEQFIIEFAKAYLGNIPVFYSKDFGHGDYNYVLPFNTKAQLTMLNYDGVLTVNVQ